jgi:hypothetical protein
VRSNRAGVTTFFGCKCNFRLQMQRAALQHLTAPRVILSSRAMLPVAAHANLHPMPASALLQGLGVAGSGRSIITTATTAISGVRWIVFA